MAGAAPKILVVDDVPANRLMYGSWLREIPEIEVVEAGSGPEALALAREHEFAMFLLDINMPGMDGFELASLLRQEKRAEGTPIVFVTAEATPRTYLMRGYRMGAVDFMVSGPVQSEILVQKARVFVQIYNKRHELQHIVERVRRENRELQERLQDYIGQQEALRLQATRDPLTKLPNRALFEDRLRGAIARSQRSRQRFALAYLDLDGFKAVNDRHGHATGDALLVSAANRLTSCVRATDTVARLGGDEFALLFEQLDSSAGVQYVAEKIHKALSAPVSLQSDVDKALADIRTGASIGIALYPEHATRGEDLMMLADMTMYAVKRAGGGARLYSGPAGDYTRAEPAARLQLVRQRRE